MTDKNKKSDDVFAEGNAIKPEVFAGIISQEESLLHNAAPHSEESKIAEQHNINPTIVHNENPYSPDANSTADVVRLFYANDIKILPVVSKAGVLIGVLKKDDVVSELSDIERSVKQGIDKFITKLAKKISFEDLLPYMDRKKFPVITIFGEEYGYWSRLKLLAAAEKAAGEVEDEHQSKQEQDAQVMEWIIYLILEHIPRPLYAVNEEGKTIFYNSYFEDLYESKKGGEVDVDFMESVLKSSAKNKSVASSRIDEFLFHNKDINAVYEKIPLMNKSKRIGYLMFFQNESETPIISVSEKQAKAMSLGKMLAAVEKTHIEYMLKLCGDIKQAAEKLGITKQTLAGRITKLGIKN